MYGCVSELAAYLEASQYLPPIIGARELSKPLLEYMYVLMKDGYVHVRHTHRENFCFVEHYSEDAVENRIYVISKLSSLYRNMGDDRQRGNRRFIYVLSSTHVLDDNHPEASWEITPQAVQALTTSKLEMLEQWAEIGGLANRIGFARLTHVKKRRWGTLCRFAQCSPEDETASASVRAMLEGWEHRRVLFNEGVKQVCERYEERSRRTRPEINSDFRRFRN